MAERSSSFAEFWLHYLHGHAHAGTRALHYLGTVIAGIGILVGLLTLNPWLAFFGILSAYALAWLGHTIGLACFNTRCGRFSATCECYAFGLSDD